MQWVAVLLLLIAGVLVSAIVTRSRLEALGVPILLAGGWFSIVFAAGGDNYPWAAVGLIALVPLAGGTDPDTSRAWTTRLAAIALAILLLALVHDDALTGTAEIMIFIAVAAAMVAFVVAGSETNRVAGVGGAQLVCVLLGVAALAADRLLWGAPINLPTLIAGIVLGMLVMCKPFGAKIMPNAARDAASVLTAWLLGDLALQGLYVPAVILAAPAALEIAIWLMHAGTAERGPERKDDDRPHGLYVEAERRGRDRRRMLMATFLAGTVTIVLALGAARGETMAALAGTLALMWMLQRYLWRLMPEKRRT
ncbi:MAG: hypothetical protein SGJ07_17540 [Rhodospirillaceae bacterium]|nr:hypothetical protein [Rhodospirillaceae bacterium]